MKVKTSELESGWDYCIRGVRIGGGCRMKVLAEIMDAHRVHDLPSKVLEYFLLGADIVDLGFGFDAKPEDVKKDLEGLQTMRVLARNMAWFLKCKEAGMKAGVQLPVKEDIIFTNFIRN